MLSAFRPVRISDGPHPVVCSPPRPTDEDRYNVELGKRITAARGKVSKSTLARALGIPRTSLILIERGQQRVHAHLLVLIAEELGVEPADLLLGRQPAPTAAGTVEVTAPPAVAAYVADIRDAARN